MKAIPDEGDNRLVRLSSRSRTHNTHFVHMCGFCKATSIRTFHSSTTFNRHSKLSISLSLASSLPLVFYTEEALLNNTRFEGKRLACNFSSKLTQNTGRNIKIPHRGQTDRSAAGTESYLHRSARVVDLPTREPALFRHALRTGHVQL